MSLAVRGKRAAQYSCSSACRKEKERPAGRFTVAIAGMGYCEPQWAVQFGSLTGMPDVKGGAALATAKSSGEVSWIVFRHRGLSWLDCTPDRPIPAVRAPAFGRTER